MKADIRIKAIRLFLRLSLAAAFLSAVADRFGLWGAPGASGVAWGEWKVFVDYTALINPTVPDQLVPVLAWVATISEVILAAGLLIGWKLRWFALGSGVLLLLFALAMALSLGIKPPLDYSVFSASAAAFALWALLDNGNGGSPKK